VSASEVVVFLGPTLAAADARALLPQANVLGPARMGDVYRTTLRKPGALLLVDGVFDQALAVWHKELLWALAQGVRVYGAASMGALRAAELAPFGMVGVGEIFEAFSRGDLEDDDEVAVAHENGGGAGSGGYRQLGEPMVNIRATLLRAEREGALDAATRARLIGVGKDLFYPERSLAAVLAGDPGPAAGTERLRRWLDQTPDARVDQKRLDAEAALRRVAADAPGFQGPRPLPPFPFEYTEAWHELRRRAGERA
jgi:hypothetical protein